MTRSRSRYRGLAAARRLVIASDVRLVRLGQERYGATHPSLSNQTLLKYLNTGLECTLLARVIPATDGEVTSVLSDSRLSVMPIEGDSKTHSALRRVIKLFRQIRAADIRGSDVLIIRVPEFVSLLAWAGSRTRNVTTISNVVAEPSAWQGRLGPASHLLKTLLHVTAWVVVRSSEASIFVSQGTLQKRYPPRPGTPTYAASNVALSASSFSMTPRHYPFDVASRPVRLIAIGTQESMTKGHDLLIASVRQLLDRGLRVELHLVGSGSQQECLKAMVDELGIQPQVQFYGNISDRSTLNDLIDRADVFVMPSRSEGVPRAMIEAMARGLLCLGSTVGGIPELAPPEARFRPNSAVAITDRLHALLNDPIMMNRVAEQQWSRAHSLAKAARPESVTNFLLKAIAPRARG